jgi:uncharacterized membrane protein
MVKHVHFRTTNPSRQANPMETANNLLIFLVETAILFFEFMGVIVIILAGIKGIFDLVKKSSMTRLNLAKGMAMGLEFKIGSEILRTVLVRELSEIFIVAGIVLLRATITLLIHWEIKNEELHSKIL